LEIFLADELTVTVLTSLVLLVIPLPIMLLGILLVQYKH
jgi:hypothetical protein